MWELIRDSTPFLEIPTALQLLESLSAPPPLSAWGTIFNSTFCKGGFRKKMNACGVWAIK